MIKAIKNVEYQDLSTSNPFLKNLRKKKVSKLQIKLKNLKINATIKP